MNKNKTGFGNECRNAWWEEKSLCAQKQISIQPYISVLRFIVFKVLLNIRQDKYILSLRRAHR